MATNCQEELAECRDETITLLETIRQATGYGYKPLKHLIVDPSARCPTWFDGEVRISPLHDARAIAHELGHGMHEKIRETGKRDQYGEDFAEAIRWFVEERMGPSKWCNGLHVLPQKSAVLNACNRDFQTFLSGLKDRSLFTALAWQ